MYQFDDNLEQEVDIEDEVTIIMKTLLRKPVLEYTISTIRQHYKRMKIIIADDSGEKAEPIEGENIEYHVMPQVII